MNCFSLIFAGLALLGFAGCASRDSLAWPPIPQLAAAQPAALQACTELADFRFDRTRVTRAAMVPSGAVAAGTTPVGEHCLVTGLMNERVSPVDGQRFAIQFEMRLPRHWSGRFLHQGNGGIDGVVAPALGIVGAGGAGQSNGLALGFAVLSSDAGHSSAQNPVFGIDPQARRDYGYAAVGSLTPMAKALIAAAYGKGPDRSYFAGSSNGGRHAMVAASRYADHYDGFLAQSPGFNLPRAAAAQLWGAQQWSKVATDINNLETAFTAAERRLVARAILVRCDALDGLADGLVNDYRGCRRAFNIQRDVPSCSQARDGLCLTSEQKQAFATVYEGPYTRAGDRIYADWSFDPGLAAPNWAQWKFRSSVGNNRDPVAAVIFAVPPEPSRLANSLGYALAFSLETDWPKFAAVSGAHPESALEMMTPRNPSNLDGLRRRGGKMIIVHGEADGVFSSNDTASFIDALDRRYLGEQANFVRYFRVPGMNHSGNGPATDQYDGLKILIDWVEQGIAPDRIVAQVRGPGNAGGANPDLPADWSPVRTRPLCPYPAIARYKGGNPESESSFACAQ